MSTNRWFVAAVAVAAFAGGYLVRGAPLEPALRVAAEPQANGRIVQTAVSVFLDPADFSPLK